MYQKISKTHENKVPKEVENRKKNAKQTQKHIIKNTYKNHSIEKTKKTENISPAHQKNGEF